MYLTAISKGINLFVHDYFLFARLVRLFDLSVILCRLTLHVILVSRLLSQRPPMAKRYKFSEEQFSTTWEKSSREVVAGLCTTKLTHSYEFATVLRHHQCANSTRTHVYEAIKMNFVGNGPTERMDEPKKACYDPLWPVTNYRWKYVTTTRD